jgi:hypothetical protein
MIIIIHHSSFNRKKIAATALQQVTCLLDNEKHTPDQEKIVSTSANVGSPAWQRVAPEIRRRAAPHH